MKHHRQLTGPEIEEIRRRLATGEKMVNMAGDFKVSLTTISNIKTGKTGKRQKI